MSAALWYLLPLGQSEPAAAESVYAAIYDWVRDALDKTETELPDTNARLVRATDSVVVGLLLRYPCLVSYASLSGDDLAAFDEAAGLLVAARLRPVLQAGANEGSGQVRRERQGPVEYEYGAGVGTKTLDKPIEQQWMDLAQQALSRIACIRAAAVTAASSFSLFALAGKSRARETATGRARPTLQDLINDAFEG